MEHNMEELERLVGSLSPLEKASLVQHILRGLEVPFPGIEVDPGICGGDPCVARTRIPVWILVQFRRSGMSEIDMLRNYPSLSASDLANAWGYYATHRDEIEQQIKENEDEE